jgi:hypothetical protein
MKIEHQTFDFQGKAQENTLKFPHSVVDFQGVFV